MNGDVELQSLVSDQRRGRQLKCTQPVKHWSEQFFYVKSNLSATECVPADRRTCGTGYVDRETFNRWATKVKIQWHLSAYP
jgi:hypothetical protein